MRPTPLLCAAVLLLTACGGNKPALVANPELTIFEASEMPAPALSDRSYDDVSYVLGPLDKVKIDVFGVEEFEEREVQLDGSGSLSFPFVGTVDASGMTTEELAALISEGLRGRYVLNPQVSVNLSEPNSALVAVQGAVKEPGLYPILGRMTLTRSVSAAKGLTDFAKLRQVVILRTVNGERYAALHDLRSIRQGLYPDPRIYSNDVVIVGESGALRAFDRIASVGALLTSPIVALINTRN